MNWKKLERYVLHTLEMANIARARAIIFSGGDTTNKSSGGPWEFRTEAEVMKTIAREKIFLTGKMMSVLLEEKAYNTLSNLENSKQMINENEEIIIVCNKAHLPKVIAAAIRVFGLKAVKQRISFRPFPLTTRKIENLMILFLKTPLEVIGYFFFPW